jgi:hypothetical protein
MLIFQTVGKAVSDLRKHMELRYLCRKKRQIYLTLATVNSNGCMEKSNVVAINTPFISIFLLEILSLHYLKEHITSRNLFYISDTIIKVILSWFLLIRNVQTHITQRFVLSDIRKLTGK